MVAVAVVTAVALTPVGSLGAGDADDPRPPLVHEVSPGPDHGPPVVDSIRVHAFDPTQVGCVARAVYHEARGEGVEGMVAVAHVVRNRVADPGFPSTPCRVVNQRAQFSWTRTLPAVDDRDSFDAALEIAVGVLTGVVPDPTGGATHFHTRSHRPWWADRLDMVASIGGHVFYR